MWYEKYGNIAAWAGVALAIISLGWNWWLTFWQSRLRIKLHPYCFKSDESRELRPGNVWLCWEITNLSSFDVYIDGLGFCSFWRFNPSYVPHAVLVIGSSKSTFSLTNEPVTFPLQLHSRQSVTVAVDNLHEIVLARRHSRMFATTACNGICVKRAPFLREIFAHAK